MKRPSWPVVVGIGSLTATSMFLIFLVVAPALGIERLDERWVTPIVAIGAGLGAAAFGGHASVSGKLPIEALNSQPVSVSLGGGLATFFLVLVLLPRVMPAAPASTIIREFELAGSVVAQSPPRVMLEARFSVVGLSPDFALVLIAYEDDQCKRELARGSIDQPQQGSMTLFLKRPRSGVACGRIAAVNSSGVVVSQTPPSRVKWDD